MPVPKKQFIAYLKDGEIVDDYFAVKFKKPPTSYQKGYWFEVRLSDKTGEITAKYWAGPKIDEVNAIYNSFNNDDVIHIIGKLTAYRDISEISINPPQGKLLKVKEYDADDFIGKSQFDTKKLFQELVQFSNSIINSEIKTVVDSFFVKDEKFIAQFQRFPAAMHLHQNYLGGLVEHTLNVVKICDIISKVYPSLDRDILIASAILHDIGKIREFKLGTSIDISEEGMLKGHITIGNEMLVEQMKKLGTSTPISLKLSHMMLSQHGKKEYGSPVQPQMPEGVALYYADDCDSKVNQYLKAKADAKTEDSWVYSSRLGHVYLK